MGCRPGKHVSSKIQASETMGGGFGAHLGSGKFTRRIRPGGFPSQVRTTTSLLACQPSTEFSDFSTTTATYSSPGFKTSKITVRLSSDGSTLEIEKYEEEPGGVLQRSESAPVLPSTDALVEQTTPHSCQHTVRADVAPIPRQYQSVEYDNSEQIVLCTEPKRRVILSNSCYEITNLTAPKATLEELDDFALDLPNARLAITEDTRLLDEAVSNETGSVEEIVSICSLCQKKPAENGKFSSNGDVTQGLLCKVSDNRFNCISQRVNCLSKADSSEVLCVGKVCQCSCAFSKVPLNNSTSSDSASVISSKSQIENNRPNLSFCSHSRFTDESWDTGISGLEALTDNHVCRKEPSRDGNLIGIYPDDLSKIDKPVEGLRIEQEQHPVHKSSLSSGKDLKEMNNYWASDKREGFGGDSSIPQSPQLISSTMASSPKSNLETGEYRIKNLNKEMPGSFVKPNSNSCNEGGNLSPRNCSRGDKCGRIVSPKKPYDNSRASGPPEPCRTKNNFLVACKEGIPVTMETKLEAEESSGKDDTIPEYAHPDFINDFNDLDEDSPQAKPTYPRPNI